MGSCCNPKNNVIYRADTIPNQRPSSVLITYIKDEEHFMDMPEIPDKYKGIGIKKMNGYKCNLNIDDLNALREHFWNTKTALNERWMILRQACLYDNSKCADFLSKNGFWTVNGCLNECSDYLKNIYRIPNYCINDPYFEKELVPIDNNTHNKIIQIFLCENDKKYPFDLCETTSGEEIKRKWCEKIRINYKDYYLRLFFGGNEIKNDQLLYQHKVLNHYIIQVYSIKINSID